MRDLIFFFWMVWSATLSGCLLTELVARQWPHFVPSYLPALAWMFMGAWLYFTLEDDLDDYYRLKGR